MITVGLHGGGAGYSMMMRKALALSLDTMPVYATNKDVELMDRMRELSVPSYEWTFDGRQPISYPGIGSIGSVSTGHYDHPPSAVMNKRRSKNKAAKKARRNNRK
ncbi:hypothetical protein VP150E351_P0090 [Vibrio phage 150E35-1]|nr:hypothetical protein VP150E351_P0090 [Vibrio phage 150E35-1]